MLSLHVLILCGLWSIGTIAGDVTHWFTETCTETQWATPPKEAITYWSTSTCWETQWSTAPPETVWTTVWSTSVQPTTYISVETTTYVLVDTSVLTTTEFLYSTFNNYYTDTATETQWSQETETATDTITTTEFIYSTLNNYYTDTATETQVSQEVETATDTVTTTEFIYSTLNNYYTNTAIETQVSQETETATDTVTATEIVYSTLNNYFTDAATETQVSQETITATATITSASVVVSVEYRTITQSCTFTTTPLVGLVLCPSRTINPTYTTSTALPTDYLWGCPPGTLCTPKQIDCNFEQGLPADSYYCSPDDCKVPPPLPPLIDDEDPHNCTPVIPIEGYFDLDPRPFGLNYNIFEFNGQPGPSCPSTYMGGLDDSKSISTTPIHRMGTITIVGNKVLWAELE
ncbi:hypothetical protein A1O3_09410 [Capronia epimyces CBS 606.96]|uniref:Uncharacterized protein n=1 Tax=Capronia epimyces CBS 606.96 TaxID=1182542 RepID=W9Y755_9EURO|nr:uncharacterized protein A1O3_09410 [Capronia epimyces CBS 606.96]EXJ78249.1 hypothetical protein A1O3_09410 [Capronia epimyces CBS 606.96]